VERLARDLGVTKGSFYWHFADRAELLEALISEWEAEADLLIRAIGVPDARSGLAGLLDQLRINVVTSEDGKVPSDAAIFAWASVDPAIDARVKTAEEERIALLATLLGSRQQAELAYMAYLGFILRRRTAPDAPKLFELFASLLLRDAPPPSPDGRALPRGAESGEDCS
jgi:AcrR family transcriptional regulator